MTDPAMSDYLAYCQREADKIRAESGLDYRPGYIAAIEFVMPKPIGELIAEDWMNAPALMAAHLAIDVVTDADGVRRLREDFGR
jgi:hypothetical protein